MIFNANEEVYNLVNLISHREFTQQDSTLWNCCFCKVSKVRHYIWTSLFLQCLRLICTIIILGFTNVAFKLFKGISWIVLILYISCLLLSQLFQSHCEGTFELHIVWDYNKFQMVQSYSKLWFCIKTVFLTLTEKLTKS